MSSGARSGLYKWSDTNGLWGELRLSVDGNGDDSKMVASGTGFFGSTSRIHWIARQSEAELLNDEISWLGQVIFKENFQYTKVSIKWNGLIARVTFTGPGLSKLIHDYTFESPFFHKVLFEYDREQGVNSTLEYQTDSHIDHPSELSAELLTIDKVFQRAGFDVMRTGEDTVVSSPAGSTWSNQELHDAMKLNFSRFKPSLAQWALWTFFAKNHDSSSLGGVMFDTIDKHRQGTALFTESFISDPPDGDATPDAWKQRMIFFTAIHEMGHAFNLRHPWKKAFGKPWSENASFEGKPWSEPWRSPTPLTPFGPLSFMTYPRKYQKEAGNTPEANTINFFQAFKFRFSDDELLFLRHAPERFVQMGNSDMNIHHAFEQAKISPAPAFSLELRTHRNGNEFEFLEPVMIELKLTNQSEQLQLVDEYLLELSDQMTVVVQRRGGSQMPYRPYARMLYKPNLQALKPKKSVYAPLFISVGCNGWLIEEPGWYEVRVCLHMEEEDIVSNLLRIRVAPPRSWDEEYLAQDFFCDEVGRTLSFDGSYYLTQANDVLNETAERLKERKVAIHAKVALNIPKTRNYKVFDETNKGRSIREIPIDEKAVEQLAEMLGSTPSCAKLAADALGHIDYNQYVKTATSSLDKMEKADLSLKVTKNMYSIFKERNVDNNVLMEIRKSIKKAEGQ